MEYKIIILVSYYNIHGYTEKGVLGTRNILHYQLKENIFLGGHFSPAVAPAQ